MKQDIIIKTLELKEMIEQSSYVIRLKETEKIMNNGSDVVLLEEIFVNAQNELNNCDLFVDELVANKLRRNVSVAKYNLEMHPKVVDYLQALKSVNAIYSIVNTEIFAYFNVQKGCTPYAYNRR